MLKTMMTLTMMMILTTTTMMLTTTMMMMMTTMMTLSAEMRALMTSWSCHRYDDDNYDDAEDDNDDDDDRDNARYFWWWWYGQNWDCILRLLAQLNTAVVRVCARHNYWDINIAFDSVAYWTPYTTYLLQHCNIRLGNSRLPQIRLNVSCVMTSETGVTGMDMRWGRNSKVRSIEFLDEIFLEGSDGIHDGVARSVDTHSTKQRTDTIE